MEERDTIDNLQEYDLSEYFRALEEFKTSHKDEVITYWGSEENFDLFIQQIRKSEAQAARLAVQEFGSVEAYTEAMKYNLEHFSEIMKKWQAQIPEELKAKDPFVKLASHKGEPGFLRCCSAACPGCNFPGQRHRIFGAVLRSCILLRSDHRTLLR